MPRKKKTDDTEQPTRSIPRIVEAKPDKGDHCSFCNAKATPDPKGLHKCMCRRERLSV